MLRVLLLDDDAAFRRLVVEALRDEAEVEEVGDVAAAVAALERHPPDCVLCDLGLPDATGPEAVGRLRRAAGPVSIVAISGIAGQGADAALSAGAEAFVRKGRELDGGLGREVHAAVARTARRRDAAAAVAPARRRRGRARPSSAWVLPLLAFPVAAELLWATAGTVGIAGFWFRAVEIVLVGTAMIVAVGLLVRGSREDEDRRRELVRAVDLGRSEWAALSASDRVGVFRTDAKGRFSWMNDFMLETTGLTRAETTDGGWRRAVHPVDLPRIAATWAAASLARATFTHDARIRHRDGQILSVGVTASPVLGPEGELHGWVGLVVDETARRAAERETEQSRSQLQAVLSASSSAIFLSDHDERYVLANPACEAAFGCPPGALVGRTVAEVLGPEEAERTRRHDRIVLADGRPRQDESVRPHPDGTEHTWLSVRFPVRDADDVLVGVGVVATDVTAHRRLEREVARQRELLEQAQHIAKLATWEWDLDADAITATSAFAEVVGLPGGTVEAARAFAAAAMDPEDRAHLLALIEASRAAIGTFELTFALRAPDQPVRHLRCRWRADRRNGRVVLIGGIQDVTEERGLTDALIAAEEQLRLAFEHAPIGLGLCDADGRWTRVNPALCALLGRDEPALLGHPVGEVLATAGPLGGTAQLLGRRTGEPGGDGVEQLVARPDGVVQRVSVSVSAVRNADGKLEQFVLQLIDVTARRALEAQLQELADTDPLTGLANRRRLEAELDHRLEHRRGVEQSALVVIEVDGLDGVADRVGHGGADRVLRRVAGILAQPGTALAARIDGGTFAVVLADSGRLEARATAEGLCGRIAAVTGGAAPGLRVTVRYGIAVLRGEGQTAPAVMREADDALQAAERAARHPGAAEPVQ